MVVGRGRCCMLGPGSSCELFPVLTFQPLSVAMSSGSVCYNHACLSLAGILILGEYPSSSPDDHACHPSGSPGRPTLSCRVPHLCLQGPQDFWLRYLVRHCIHVSTCTCRYRTVSRCMVDPGSKDGLPRARPYPRAAAPGCAIFPARLGLT